LFLANQKVVFIKFDRDKVVRKKLGRGRKNFKVHPRKRKISRRSERSILKELSYYDREREGKQMCNILLLIHNLKIHDRNYCKFYLFFGMSK